MTPNQSSPAEPATVEGLLQLVIKYGIAVAAEGIAARAEDGSKHHSAVRAIESAFGAIRAYAASLSAPAPARGPMTEERLRESFEKHIKQEHECPQFSQNFWLLQRRNGAYMQGTTFFAWEQWKSCAVAIEAETAAPAVVRMLTDDEVFNAVRQAILNKEDTFDATQRKLIEVNGLKLEGDA